MDVGGVEAPVRALDVAILWSGRQRVKLSPYWSGTEAVHCAEPAWATPWCLTAWCFTCGVRLQFVDAGQTPDIDNFLSAVGFGYRIKLPIVGITRFDVAFPLNKVDNNNAEFHLELGHTF